jgi:methionyl-tRNA synthetase
VASKPWLLAKSAAAADRQALHVACTQIECFRLLTLYLKPVLAARAEAFLRCGALAWPLGRAGFGLPRRGSAAGLTANSDL